jgi:hypothetical protein
MGAFWFGDGKPWSGRAEDEGGWGGMRLEDLYAMEDALYLNGVKWRVICTTNKEGNDET